MLIIANSIGVESGRFRGVPNEIKILPVGMVKSQKGNFYVDKESSSLMKENMESHGVDIVIDYEHQTLKDCQAPTGGWIKKLEYTPDAIVAKVEWTLLIPTFRELLLRCYRRKSGMDTKGKTIFER